VQSRSVGPEPPTITTAGSRAARHGASGRHGSGEARDASRVNSSVGALGQTITPRSFSVHEPGAVDVRCYASPMKHPEGRYCVCDDARRAPNNSSVVAGGNGVQHWGDDGESERFDDLQEAQVFARSLWESQGRHHVIVIKDKTEGARIVQAFKAEPHDTMPETSADETQRVQVVPLVPQR